jgi:nucleotide-binding universal stress UspA family protein
MKVLVATDGSEASWTAVRLAGALAWPAGSLVRVVSVVDAGTALFGGPWPTAALVQADEIQAGLRAVADRALRDAAAALARPGIEVETTLLEGRPAIAVVDEADRIGADLIIAGSRGHGTLETMLLGSVTAELLDQARIPVMVARRPIAQRAVLAWDGSEGAEAAARIVESWPAFRSIPVRVVTVLASAAPWWAASSDPGAPTMIPAILDAIDAERDERRAQNVAMTERLRAAGLAAEGVVRDGDPAGQLIDAATADLADLIVMGTHGRSGLARLALGSVARNVVTHAPCTVLVVRAPAAPEETAGRP